MANKELDQMRSLLSNIYSEAESKPQPSKKMNGGSAKIDGANPTSPSTNPATRREQYNNYIKTLDEAGRNSLYNTVVGYKSSGMSNDDIYDRVLNDANIKPVTPSSMGDEEASKKGVDLSIKGNFDIYNPINWESQPELLQQYYVQANNDIKSSRRALSQYMLQQDSLNSKSGNVEQVTTLIDAIENAYDKGIFDTQTIANTLGVSPETVSLIQQGKANELITLKEDFVQDQLKAFYRKEEDYDIGLQRVMEDYQIAKTNLDHQYNSAMQTLKRNLFDDKWKASVGSAVAGISGSEYAVRTIEAKHQQNMDDLENNYLYSSMTQKYSYTRAIEDYNTNLKRLSEDFDDSLKEIQASVLQQFQEIDNKIGLTTAQLAKAYGTLEQNVITAKSTATTNYIEALANNENGLADAIANTFGLDTSNIGVHQFTAKELGRTWKETIGNATNNIGHILASNDGTRVGTYKSPNGYTYNVYATREEGLQATIGLLQRAYYGMTLQAAAQKWIGQGKDISAAKKVLQGLGLDLNAKLSDENVQKFITAMGRWEGTLGQNETIEQWLKGGNDLSSYGEKTDEESTSTGSYIKGYEQDYRNYNINGTDGFTDSSKKALKEKFGSWDKFVANAQAYTPEMKKEDLKVLQQGLDRVDSIMKEYEDATKDMNEAEIATAILAFSDPDSVKQAAMARAYPKLYTTYRKFNQRVAQGFIDTIISSKKSGATYGQLTDREGDKLTVAFSPASMSMPKDEFIRVMQEARDDLQQNVSEVQKVINGESKEEKGGGDKGGGDNGGIGLSDLFNIFNKIPKSSDLIFSGASTNDTGENNTGFNNFTIPGGMNTTGQNNTGKNNTGTFEFPRTNMK